MVFSFLKLYEKGDLDEVQSYIHQNNIEDMYIPFLIACSGGNNPVVDWICSSNPSIEYIQNINEAGFEFACSGGHTDLAKKFMNAGGFDIKKKIHNMFQNLCQTKHFNTIRWVYLLSIEFDDPIDIYAYNDYYFRLACYRGDCRLAQWLYSLSESLGKPYDISEDVFKRACNKNGIEIIEWLYTIKTIDATTGFIEACKNGAIDLAKRFIIRGADIHSGNDKAFRMACKSGGLETVKWLYTLENIDINSKNDKPFLNACQSGHLEIAQWLYNLEDIDITSDDNLVIKSACKGNHIDIVQWLYSLGKIDIHLENDLLFLIACRHGSLKTAQWLYSLGGFIINHDVFVISAYEYFEFGVAEWLYSIGEIDIHQDYEAVFRYCCECGNLEMAQWLYKLSIDNNNPINIHILNDDAIIRACERNHYEILKWIHSIDELKEAYDKVFTSACSYNHIEIARWLCQLNPTAYTFTVVDNKIVDWNIKTMIDRMNEYITTSDIMTLSCFDFQRSEDMINDGCYICHDTEFDRCELQCKHTYCLKCIFNWIIYSRQIELKCPYCTNNFEWNKATIYLKN